MNFLLDDLTEKPLKRVRSKAQAVKLLEEIICDVRNNRIDAKQANAIGYLVNTAISLTEGKKSEK